MERKIFTLLLGAAFGTFLMAQAPEGVVKRTTILPVIDGEIDAVWDTANVYNIDKPFSTEIPTLGSSGETTWKALWGEDGIYILIQVTDDVWQPAYSGTTPGEQWNYDKPEIYFDVNSDLIDGLGPEAGMGHYCVTPDFVDGQSDGTPVTNSDGIINAFLVTDPNYVAEYFIPFSYLLDNEGVEVLKTATIGFDVTMNDCDVIEPVRNRAVWANDVEPESYVNMDNCGTITLEGTGDAILVTSIVVSSADDATTIETEAGTLQMSAAILPVNATFQTVTWKVTNGTGKATISTDGLLTAHVNGTVTVVATSKDGANVTASKEITILNQIVTLMDLSVIKEGDFPVDGPLSGAWGMWTDNGSTAEVIDGVCTMTPGSVSYNYALQVNQSGWIVYNDLSYILTFTAWADADRSFSIDFEDPNNSYKRFGSSDDVEAVNGESEWLVPITKTPTTFTFHTTIINAMDNTKYLLNIMPSAEIATVYIDDISVVNVDDLNKLSTAVPSVSATKVLLYPNPVVNELNISLSSPDSRVTIYNSIGSKLEDVFVKGTDKVKFDVSSYTCGLYLVKVNNDTVVKFVK
jgi:hypothetical protein